MRFLDFLQLHLPRPDVDDLTVNDPVHLHHLKMRHERVQDQAGLYRRLKLLLIYR